MQLVVNEWMLDFLVPGAENQQIAKVNKFIKFISENSHQIVIGRKNNFVSKLYHYMKRYGWNLIFKARFKKLSQLLFFDHARTKIIEEHELTPLSDEIISITPDDDLYLLQLAFSTEDKTIITTDARLKNVLQIVQEVNICLLDDYFADNGIDC